MNDHTRVRVFAPCRGARWGVFNTPLHGYDHSGHRPAPWYGHSGPWGLPGGAYSIRPYTGTRLNKPTGRKAPTHKQFEGASADGPCRGREAGRVLKTPVPDAPRPRKVSKRAAERFRRVGKLKNAPLRVSEASEGSKRAAERFRDFGKAGYPTGCPAFFACTNLPLWPAITIRSYRYIPFNIFFDSTEKRTIFVANFHVRCR